MGKSNPGNFFEDFKPGMVIRHATPRTLTEADQALYIALTGDRHALFCADTIAMDCGLQAAPLDPLLVFHVVFGKTVPDISLNAVANLGYAEGRFLKPVYPGDTLRAESEILGVRENSNGKTGVVFVRTTGFDQEDDPVLSYCRWVMVNKRGNAAPPPPSAPRLADAVGAKALVLPEGLDFTGYDDGLGGARWRFEDYSVGEKIDHVDGMTVEEAEHQIATRLYQNTAKVHFNLHEQARGRFGKRLIYGGVVLSIARALSFNGLENASLMLAINGGRHVAPLFAGDTVFAWSEVLETATFKAAPSVGALRLRVVATRNRPCADFPYKAGATGAEAEYDPAVILDFDYWVAIPRRG